MRREKMDTSAVVDHVQVTSSLIGTETHDKPIKCQLGHLYRADGSSALSLGDTTVWTGLFGPGDIAQSKKLTDEAVLEVHIRPAIAKPGPAPAQIQLIQTLLSGAVSSCVQLHKFPRSLIELSGQELHNDGSLTSVMLNSACLSLLHAGLPMFSCFAAVTIALLEHDQSKTRTLVLSPSLKQESAAKAMFELVYANSETDGERQMNIVACSATGRFTVGEYESAIEMGKDTARHWLDIVYTTSVMNSLY